MPSPSGEAPIALSPRPNGRLTAVALGYRRAALLSQRLACSRFRCHAMGCDDSLAKRSPDPPVHGHRGIDATRALARRSLRGCSRSPQPDSSRLVLRSRGHRGRNEPVTVSSSSFPERVMPSRPRSKLSVPWPPSRGPRTAAVKVRMGIHTGEVNLADTHRGVAVHRAARISAAAHGGQIVLSQSTQTMVEDVEVLVPDLSFSDLGDHLIKDFDRPVRLYQLVAPGLDERFPPLAASSSRSGADAGRRPELPAARKPRSESRRPPARDRRAEAARRPRDPCSECRAGCLDRPPHRSPLGRAAAEDGRDLAPELHLAAAQDRRRGRRRHQGARLSPERRRRANRRQPVRATRCRGAVARARGSRQATP